MKKVENNSLCIKEQHLSLIALLRSQLYAIEQLLEDQRKHLLCLNQHASGKAALAINQGIKKMLETGEI